MKFACSIVLLFSLGLSVWGQSADQLTQLVADLQKAPDDAALREKIIKLAQTMAPKPATPPEADEEFGKAKYLIKNATSDADFAAAAKAFATASNLAPWEPNYYYNQALMFDKSKQYAKAIEAMRWFLMAAPDSPDARVARELIGGYKIALEKANTAERERVNAEEARLRAEANRRAMLKPIEDLKRMVNGRSYYMSYCTVGKHAEGAASVPNGCTWKETEGKNWYTYWKGEATDKWDFSEEGEARLVSTATGDISRIRVRGRSTGPNLSDIRWECPVIRWSMGTPTLSGWKPAYLTHFQDFSNLTLGCDNDNPSVSPAARFQYTQFTMN